jgi:hypothetical protein
MKYILFFPQNVYISNYLIFTAILSYIVDLIIQFILDWKFLNLTTVRRRNVLLFSVVPV